jgi:gamma-glutamyltranspeptidase/glutathione hydrolase
MALSLPNSSTKQLTTDFYKTNGPNSLFSQVYRQVMIKYPALAATLKRIAKKMVVMSLKEKRLKLVAFLNTKDGNMTLEDLSQYEAKWRAPITFTYKDLKLLLCPTQQRRILFEPNNENDEPFNLTEMGHNSLKAIQVITEGGAKSIR